MLGAVLLYRENEVHHSPSKLLDLLVSYNIIPADLAFGPSLSQVLPQAPIVIVAQEINRKAHAL